jgi:hypothetical protein
MSSQLHRVATRSYARFLARKRRRHQGGLGFFSHAPGAQPDLVLQCHLKPMLLLRGDIRPPHMGSTAGRIATPAHGVKADMVYSAVYDGMLDNSVMAFFQANLPYLAVKS